MAIVQYSGFQDICKIKNDNSDENCTCTYFNSHFEWKLTHMRDFQRFSLLFILQRS